MNDTLTKEKNNDVMEAVKEQHRQIEELYRKQLGKSEHYFLTEARVVDGKVKTPIDELIAGRMTIQYLVDMMQHFLDPKLLRIGSSVIGNDESLQYNRSVVNSQLIALNAMGNEEVIKFRKDVLRNKLITQGKIEGWIKRRAKKDGDPTKLNVQPYGIKVLGYELMYWIPDQNRVKSIYVVSGGILAKLREVSIHLSVALGWTKAQTTSWVLTGIAPKMEAIQVGAEIYPAEPVANKLTLKIDPTSTNDEVLAAYNWARDKFFEPKTTKNTTKSELLALLYRQHERKSRREKLKIWNALCGSSRKDWKESWSYDPVKGINNFQTALKNAYNKYMQGRKPQ